MHVFPKGSLTTLGKLGKTWGIAFLLIKMAVGLFELLLQAIFDFSR